MKEHVRMNRLGKALEDNRILKFVVLVYGFAVVFNSFMIYRALHYQKVVLIPPGLDRKATVSGNNLDDAYVSAFARYVAGLAFSYTPASAKKQFEELLTLFAPEAYPEGKRTFYVLGEKIVETRSSSAFYVDRIEINPEKNRLEVFGMKKLYIDDRKIEDSAKTYWIEFKVNNGRFAVVSISEALKETAARERPP
ncbi:MAG: type IV conjugative transfer system protein TraE [Syntrophales bacterium]|nr:type IV conjugative transfer system protein TraE [Syntrophales bacterium]MDD5532759.1 type IV conjugative transfer system protein TraE [Syntrophales bacterium]